MLRRIFSFFTPVRQKKISSEYNKTLEVSWQNGRLVLDTPQTNYSYGNLHDVLKQGLSFIGFQKIKPMKNILVLGLGAGSIISLLRKDVRTKALIDSVEIDSAVIMLAKQYFHLDDFDKKHHIHQKDAFEYVLGCEKAYDLIVIDVFIDSYMPEFLFAEYFVKHLKRILKLNGFILFNTIVADQEQVQRNQTYLQLFDQNSFTTKVYDKAAKYNEIITVKRAL